MRLILTHEQADFDALASMLGAYLLDETALPVLPRRMNRNVRAFITLYGADLPFIDPRDLPSEHVESICLVDAQSMATIRGVDNFTQVMVVDHHSARSDFPATWSSITIEEVGATTTILVEQLRETINGLNVVQASLLLLGIYEDTGSLTYSRTTSRDLIAASFLLDQGANLSIINDFLNHPLSKSQQEIYDRLRESIESLELQGNRILIATGNAQDMDEELSTVVHKLRDLLDPDAIFVLVSTRSGVQMICRSMTDYIDVAEIAAFFGGGGHSRASASLTKGETLTKVKNDLISVLPNYVKPAVTVSEIMSTGAQTLTPETTVQEAALRMQRYGHEGYPVVKDGKVIGLLTRRAVDRALAHRLNLTASSLMNAGEIKVKPEDSIDHLQRVMTDSGWGQVPVIRDSDGAILGIVTRTDFLKTITSKKLKAHNKNVSNKLDSTLSPIRLALLKSVSEIATDHRMAIYIVGGFVRDLILGIPSFDFDIVVEGDAIVMAESLYARFGGRITSHTRFGTAKWLIDPIREDLAVSLGFKESKAELPHFLDFISARTEFYTQPTALPTVEKGNIKLDLHRRDFTINTLAVRLDGKHYGELHDYWGGMSDLKNGFVRVLHSLSFVDDPTRMLRAVRFEQRFGFKIEDRTRQLLGEALTLMGRVSGERVRHELDHILDEKNNILMLERLGGLGLLHAIHPQIQWNQDVSDRMKRLSEINPEDLGSYFPTTNIGSLRKQLLFMLWFIDYPEDKIQAILSRIRYPSYQIQHVLISSQLYNSVNTISGKNPSWVVTFLDNFPRLAVYANYLVAKDKWIRTSLERYLTDWYFISPHITGDDLRARGISPGPIYKVILDKLRGAWLDGEISSQHEEQVLLDNLLSSLKSREDT